MTGSATKQSRIPPKTLDCFASVAMTVLPRRGTLHGRLARRIRGPQFHALVGVAGIDRKFAAFEQGLQAAIAELLRRPAAAQLCGELHDKGSLQRPVKNQAGIAL